MCGMCTCQCPRVLPVHTLSTSTPNLCTAKRKPESTTDATATVRYALTCRFGQSIRANLLYVPDARHVSSDLTTTLPHVCDEKGAAELNQDAFNPARDAFPRESQNELSHLALGQATCRAPGASAAAESSGTEPLPHAIMRAMHRQDHQKWKA